MTRTAGRGNFQHVRSRPFCLEPIFNQSLAGRSDRKRVLKLKEFKSGSLGRMEALLMLGVQHIAHQHSDAAEVNLNRTRLLAFLTDRAVI